MEECVESYAGDDEFRVKDGFTTFVVNLRARVKDGRMGINCHHIIDFGYFCMTCL